MSGLSLLEKIELGAVPVCIALAGWLPPGIGLFCEVGEAIGGAALLLLAQGFFRDLYLFWETKRTKPEAKAVAARCMCVESAIGLTGVLAGVGLTGIGVGHPLHLEPTHIMVLTAAVLIVGFLLKDLVFEWSPWKIFRGKNHAQIIFRWSK